VQVSSNRSINLVLETDQGMNDRLSVVKFVMYQRPDECFEIVHPAPFANVSYE
jgi:hypothetical protein